MSVMECDECGHAFNDSFMWWSGLLWLCFECAIPHLEYDDEEERDRGEDLCSCVDGEIDIICRECF